MGAGEGDLEGKTESCALTRGALDARGKDRYQLLTWEDGGGSSARGMDEDAPPIMLLTSSYETIAGTKRGDRKSVV